MKKSILLLSIWIIISFSSGPALASEDNYRFNKPPYIHPAIIKDLSTWLSDTGDQVVAINLTDSQDSNRYFGDIQVREITGESPYIYFTKDRDSFGYQYVGQTKDGAHILYTSDSGGGSGVFKNLMFVMIEADRGIVFNEEEGVIASTKGRVIIKKLGAVVLGDRWAGELTIKGNELVIGKDEGWFAITGGAYVGGKFSKDLKERIIRINTSED
jgi:hypothetical protein|tara:strand:- start:250 stop:891 length:642 start_codon:yes stop_codon:yes gene_type:complete